MSKVHVTFKNLETANRILQDGGFSRGKPATWVSVKPVTLTPWHSPKPLSVNFAPRNVRHGCVIRQLTPRGGSSTIGKAALAYHI